jgi:hypothetical protein
VLSSDSLAQVRFRQLVEEWRAASPEGRAELEPSFRQYLSEFPYDDPRRLAWAYLAWILVQKGELLEARELVDRVRSGPSGTSNDFARVAEAALLLQLNQPQEALTLIRPLRGKLIDPAERFLLAEQLVAAAIASDLHGEALLYMVDVGALAPVTQRQSVREAIVSQLHATPRRYLEQALLPDELSASVAEEQDPARRDQHDWLREAIARRLSALAVEERDVELANFVLSHSPGLAADVAAAEELMRLAASHDTSAQIFGRTIGFVLTTESAEQRLRSTEVVTAISVALGLPTSEPKAGSVRLVFAEDSGGEQGAARAYAELSAQGVGLAIAGVDEVSASAHSREAERSRLPTVLLALPAPGASSYSFSLGVSRAAQQALLTQELATRGFYKSELVTAESEVCSKMSNRATSSWLRAVSDNGLDSIVMLGPEACAQELVVALNGMARSGPRKNAARPPLLALGLEAAPALSALDPAWGLRLSAGKYPFKAGDASIALWETRLGRTPTWSQTLGRDAAALASLVLRALPETNVTDAPSVERFHEQVRAHLSQFNALALWSSDSSRFGADHVVERQLKVSNGTH